MSIFDGFGSVVDEWLGIDNDWDGASPRYRHKSSLNKLCEKNVPVGTGKELVTALYERLNRNWDGMPSTGRQNWRHTQNLSLNKDSTSLEITLQRTFMQAMEAKNETDWANEVPVASGVADTSSDSVDFVVATDSGYSMIELKWPRPSSPSENPLKAAIQVLRYGLAYVFSRVNADELEYKIEDKPILQASEVHLRVLAPQHFYQLSNSGNDWLKNLEIALNVGISSLAKHHNLTMSFAYEQFPPTFEWVPADCDDDNKRKTVVEAFQNRKRVFCVRS